MTFIIFIFDVLIDVFPRQQFLQDFSVIKARERLSLRSQLLPRLDGLSAFIELGYFRRV